MSSLEFSSLRAPRIVTIPIAFNEELKIGSVLEALSSFRAERLS